MNRFFALGCLGLALMVSPLLSGMAGSAVPAPTVRRILQANNKPLSLEMPVGDDSFLGEFLRDEWTPAPLDAMLAGDVSTQVERALGALSDKEAQILRLRFGFR